VNRDFRVLGIDETDDVAAIKKAYRRRVKELHPDTADTGEILENHFRFVEVCAAYRRIMAGRAKPRDPGPTAPGAKGSNGARASSPAVGGIRYPTGSPPGGQRGLKPHADPAWAYYRKGTEYLSRIHPSQWNANRRMTVDAKLAHDVETQRETAARVRELVKLFPKAYLCFGTVVNEYPDSPWADDARDKMRIIEERMVRYKSIIASFVGWADYRQKEREEFTRMMEEGKRRYDAFPGDERDRWEKD